MLNKQGPGKIDWTDWSWNPITGCLHGCPYCYMLRMEKRFPGIMKPAFKPEYPDRLKNVRKVKPGDKVFVGSSGDMWGSWVRNTWISSVLLAVQCRKENTFQFLTKNPVGYRGWYFPKNCWIGTTVDGTRRTEKNLNLLLDNTPSTRIRFVSFEPLLHPIAIHMDTFSQLDWIIIGADSNRGAQKPPTEWAAHLRGIAKECGIPVWIKDNYGFPDIVKEFPA